MNHGTSVSGIALYGDVEESIRSKRFIPYFYILSGKILHENNMHEEKFIENQIKKAVREFHSDTVVKYSISPSEMQEDLITVVRLVP